jgi:hypothetical protein
MVRVNPSRSVMRIWVPLTDFTVPDRRGWWVPWAGGLGRVPLDGALGAPPGAAGIPGGPAGEVVDVAALEPSSVGAAAAAIDRPPPRTATVTNPPIASSRGERREPDCEVPGVRVPGVEVSGVGISGVVLTGDDRLSGRTAGLPRV